MKRKRIAARTSVKRYIRHSDGLAVSVLLR